MSNGISLNLTIRPSMIYEAFSFSADAFHPNLFNWSMIGQLYQKYLWFLYNIYIYISVYIIISDFHLFARIQHNTSSIDPYAPATSAPSALVLHLVRQWWQQCGAECFESIGRWTALSRWLEWSPGSIHTSGPSNCNHFCCKTWLISWIIKA